LQTIDYYLHHPEQLDTIRQNGRQATEMNTYQNRARQALAMLANYQIIQEKLGSALT